MTIEENRCGRCWKENPAEIHTCTPKYHMSKEESIIYDFGSMLDERLETNDHKYNCMAWSEWSDCCLCNADDRFSYSWRRDKIIEFLRKALSDNNNL